MRKGIGCLNASASTLALQGSVHYYQRSLVRYLQLGLWFDWFFFSSIFAQFSPIQQIDLTVDLE